MLQTNVIWKKRNHSISCELTCSKNHMITLYHNQNWICDICDSEIKTKSALYCSKCDFACCNKCQSKETTRHEKEKQAQKDQLELKLQQTYMNQKIVPLSSSTSATKPLNPSTKQPRPNPIVTRQQQTSLKATEEPSFFSDQKASASSLPRLTSPTTKNVPVMPAGVTIDEESPSVVAARKYSKRRCEQM